MKSESEDVWPAELAEPIMKNDKPVRREILIYA